MAVPLSFHGGFWLFRIISVLFFSFFSYLKFNVVYRMGVLRVFIVDTGVDDSWYRGVGGRCSALFLLCFSNAVVVADCFVEH